MKSRASLAAPLLALAACASNGGLPPAPSAGSAGPASAGVPIEPPLIGAPYEVNGVTYTPSNPAHYDEVGLASYYGAELGGRPTANGESFNPAGTSAAHRTLPLPSYVEVTSLDTGRTILVRINDRGPFHRDRIIDLSVGAAERLGIMGRGSAAVRVRLVQPSAADRSALRNGQPAGARLDASPQLLAALRQRMASGGGMIAAARPAPDAPGSRDGAVPPPAQAPEPSSPGVTWQEPPPTAPSRQPSPASRPARGQGWFVQLGAFSSAANAQRLASRAARLGPVDVSTSGNLRRVRIGPYASEREAQRALVSARAAGYGDARIFRE